MRPVRFNGSGYDKGKHDQWGYSLVEGLTKPDDQGRRYNSCGWVYDENNGECYNPDDPDQTMRFRCVRGKGRYGTYYKNIEYWAWNISEPCQKQHRDLLADYEPPKTPNAPMTYTQWHPSYSLTDTDKARQTFDNMQQRLQESANPVPGTSLHKELMERYRTQGRVSTDPKACKCMGN